MIPSIFALLLALPGTQPLTTTGDPSMQMIDGIHAYLKRAIDASVPNRKPTRERLRYIVGAVDRRVEFNDLEILATVGTTSAYDVLQVRWPVLEGVHGEGLLYRPKSAARAAVIYLPDAMQTPESLPLPPALAAGGAEVLVPVLIDRLDTWSGNPKIRMTSQPHREFLYRMAFPVGRHPIGYEVEKVLSAVDWFGRKHPKLPVGIWGYGEGGLIALYSAAIDERIGTALVSGYFQPRENVWREPIDRNVWSLLRDFGDAGIASLISAPRKLIVETTPGPTWGGPSTADPKRRGGAVGTLEPVSPEAARKEADRARALGANIETSADAMPAFSAHLKLKPARSTALAAALTPPPDRMHRQFQELVEYTQRIVRASADARDEYWASPLKQPVKDWPAATASYRKRIWEDVIGDLPPSNTRPNARTRESYSGKGWKGYEVMLDVAPDVFAYGVLLLPDNIKPGERRPVVVAQHGLNGRPQSMFGQPADSRDFGYYQNIAEKLAEMGFIVYAPQNPYIHDDHFRMIQRLGNPLRLSMFSFILAQSEKLLDWLESLPFVDAKRIGFYGLSYGGKTALRAPPLLDRYALSICSGDFNEWIVKLTSVDGVWSYMFTAEWEIPEWNLGHIANHAELARLMAPRPFMVERGHRDGVAVDEWVAFEYAKVQRFYDESGIGDRARMEFFNGPHRINGVGTVEFLKRFLNWGN